MADIADADRQRAGRRQQPGTGIKTQQPRGAAVCVCLCVCVCVEAGKPVPHPCAGLPCRGAQGNKAKAEARQLRPLTLALSLLASEKALNARPPNRWLPSLLQRGQEGWHVSARRPAASRANHRSRHVPSGGVQNNLVATEGIACIIRAGTRHEEARNKQD